MIDLLLFSDNQIRVKIKTACSQTVSSLLVKILLFHGSADSPVGNIYMIYLRHGNTFLSAGTTVCVAGRFKAA